MSLTKQVKIILVETSSAANIGSSLRAMKTMGFTELVLVKPKKFPSKEVEILASNASDLIEKIKVVEDLDAALEGIEFVVATSSRQRKVPWPTEDLPNLSNNFIEAASQKNTAILFGREDRGLTNTELQRANIHLNIPANPDYPVLNLAMSVQLVCYELFSHDAEGAFKFQKNDNWDIPKANTIHLKNLIDHFIKVSEQLEVFNKGNPRQIEARIKRLFSRIGLDEMEVNFLRGFLSAAEKNIRK